ncbi:hypothetical protein QDK53_41505, partial [Amycolatopsis magusensis]|nr:hypothetical protein [Amycolatopsis magusensis]
SVPGGALPLLAGSVLLGAGTTGLMLGRYVAADLVPVTRRPQAMGLAVGAVTVGAVCGPVLLGPAGEVARWLGLPAPLGLYLLAVVVFPVAAVISLRIGEGAAIPAATGERIRAGPVRMKPLLVLGAANLTMVSVMGAAPNHLHHHGWGLTAIGVLIGVHIAAMYGPAPLTGALCRRFGARRIALAGTVVMVAAVLLGTRHGGPAWDITLLVLLGLAWNLGLVSGSAWLVEVTPAALRHRTEGLGELVMGTAAAAGALGAAGPLLAVGGLPVLCGVLAAGNVLAAIAIAWGRR